MSVVRIGHGTSELPLSHLLILLTFWFDGMGASLSIDLQTLGLDFTVTQPDGSKTFPAVHRDPDNVRKILAGQEAA